MGRWNALFCSWLAALAGALFFISIAVAVEQSAVERFRAAAALQDRALYDLAEVEYNDLIREHADDSLVGKARLQRGICLFQLGRYEHALAELRQAKVTKADCGGSLVEQYYAYLGLVQYNVALAAEGTRRASLFADTVDALDRQLKECPNGRLAAQAAFYRAEAFYLAGRLDAARTAYRDLLLQYPEHPQRADALFALGVTEQELGQFAEALHAFERLHSEFPGHASATDAGARLGVVLVSLAELQLERGDSAAALATIDRFVAEHGEHVHMAQALVMRARAQIERSKPRAAETALDLCLERCSQREIAYEAHLLRATLRHQRGDFEGGAVDASAALADDLTSAERSAALHIRGLCELGLKKPAVAAATLQQIVEADPRYAALDRVLYDLAWAYQSSQQSTLATNTFARLAETHPASPLAAECYYRVGEARHAAKEVASAAEQFCAAADTATDATLREKSLHQLAWCQFEMSAYKAAQTSFERQLADQPNGPLAADAQVMAAECQFQRQEYRAALAAWERHRQFSASAALVAMALAHDAQAAAKLNQWHRCLESSDQLRKAFPQSDWVRETRCERATALFELAQFDEAERDFTALAAGEDGVLAVRAEFMLGQIHAARKQYDAAVRLYFKAAYGHGDRDSTQTHQHWQAEAIYAAARALEETDRPSSARTLYQELVDRYPTSARAALARESLERTVRR